MKVENIRKTLRTLKITNDEAAEFVGIHSNHLSKIINGRGYLTNEVDQKLQEFIRNAINERRILSFNTCNLTDPEFNLPHNFEWQKLKETNLYKSLML